MRKLRHQDTPEENELTRETPWLTLFKRGKEKSLSISPGSSIAWLSARANFTSGLSAMAKPTNTTHPSPQDFWLEERERECIIAFHQANSLEGYRRLAVMMLDRDLVAVSPARTWRALLKAGLMERRNRKPSNQGIGFVQLLLAHAHRHVDHSYLDIHGTFTTYAACLTDAAA